MRTPIYFRRGNKVDLPVLNAGEPGFAVDTKQLFVGASGGNVALWGDNTLSARSNVLASANASTNMATSNTWYKIALGAKSSDNLTEFDTSQSRFTAKHAGLYHIDAQYGTISVPINTVLLLAIYKNGVIDKYISQAIMPISANVLIHGTSKISLNANDYIEVFVTSNTSNINGDSSGQATYMLITQIA